MLEAHLPLLITLVIAVGLGAAMLIVAWVLGPRRPSEVKSTAWECGNPSSGDARQRFNARFYLVAILFLVFDIEAVFIYPWAVVFSDSARGGTAVPALVAVVEIAIFVAVILVGLAYAWRKGALEWGPTKPTGLEEGEPEH